MSLRTGCMTHLVREIVTARKMLVYIMQFTTESRIDARLFVVDILRAHRLL